MFDEEIEFRSWICKNCTCAVDKKDPCASCPQKKWGKYVLLCEDSQDAPKQQVPNLIKMIRNFGTAITEESAAILKKKEAITDEEKNKRFEVCKSCEFFIASSQRCAKCGCYMPIKTGWRSQKCPIGKW
jgi:hypothetical protein